MLISPEDVEIVSSEIEGWVVESEEGVTVALDTELTDDLIAEGLAREFVNRIQNMRKDAGFDVTDRIKISFSTTGKLHDAVIQHSDYISSETLSGSVTSVTFTNDFDKELEIDQYSCKIKIEKSTVN